jgi:HEAT repeat protein
MGLFGPPNVEKLKARGDVAGLIKALDYQKDDLVRDQAAVALGDLGDPGAVAALIAALKDNQSKVRIAAAGALGQIGAPSAVEPLIAALKDKENGMSVAAAQALKKIGPPAFKMLIAMLEGESWDVRTAAAEALGQISARLENNILRAEVVAALGTALKDNMSRAAAADALEKIGWKPGKDEVGAAYWVTKQEWGECVEIGTPAVEPLIEALKENNYDVCMGAAGALGQIGDPHAVQSLIAALYDSNIDLCKSAAAALVQIGNPQAIDGLISRLHRGGGEIRKIAADALGQTGDPRTVGPLVAALKDSDSGLRETAATALVKIGLPAFRPLIETLRDENRYARAAAAEALGQVGPRLADGALRVEAVTPLGAALQDVDVFQPAAAALGQIGGPEATSQLIAFLQDANPNQAREAAAGALDKIGWLPGRDANGAAYWIVKQNWDHCIEIGALAVKPLVVALQDGQLREAASNALVKIGVSAVDPLLAALKDRKNDVRKAAASTLDRIGWRPERTEIGAYYWISKQDWDECIEIGEAAVDPLIATQNDELVDVRKGATVALGQVGVGLNESRLQPQVTNGLIAALQDKESIVRQAAADGLGLIGAKLEEGALLDRITQALIPALKNVPQAVIALVKIGTPAVDVLLSALKNKDDQLREKSAVALGPIGDEHAISPLITTLNDKFTNVRQAAAAALGEVSSRLKNTELGAQMVAPLIAALNDTQGEVVKAAADALVIIGPPAVEPLVTALKDEKSKIHEQAAGVLEKIGWQPGQDVAGAAYWVVKQNWAKCFEIGAPAFEQLIPALLNQGTLIPLVVEGWLVKIGLPAVEPLISALQDSRSEVRQVAGAALGQLGDARAVGPLISILGHNDWLTRKRAAEGLVRMYRSGSLDEASRQVILTQRARISTGHNDRNEHADVDRTNSDCHSDFNRHTDNNGIGIPFPD